MRPRMMDAEVLHDSILSASGELDRNRPTESFFARFHPYRDAEWSSFKPFVTRGELVTTHRAAYLPVIRGVLPEALELFDFAPPDRPVAERTESVVPTQALYLMNHPRMGKFAELAAQRSAEEGRSGAARVTWLFRTVLGRNPGQDEVARVLAFVAEAEDVQGGEARWADAAHMLFGSVEHRLVR
jgi:transglutaminase-like putative cysteine protease